MPAKDWFLEGARMTFQSNRNVSTLKLNEYDFVNEVEVAYRRFIEFITCLRLNKFGEMAKVSSSDSVNVPSKSVQVTTKTLMRTSDELYFILFPLFVHIFIQLFEWSYVSNGKKFLCENYVLIFLLKLVVSFWIIIKSLSKKLNMFSF